VRDQFEMKNLGSFEKIYPLLDDPSTVAKNKEYQHFLKYAGIMA
jgi:hypothetical protein